MTDHLEERRPGERVADSIGRTGRQLNEGIVGGLKGLNDIETEVFGLVRNTVSLALRTSQTLAHEGIDVTTDVARGLITGASDVAADMAVAARRAVDGALEATRDIGGKAVESVRDVLIGAVHAAKDVARAARPNTSQSKSDAA